MADTKYSYGWVRRPADPRNLKYKRLVGALPTLPSHVDLRPYMNFPIYDQGDLGSCTANATAALGQFLLIKQKRKVFVPSRLFIYFTERSIDEDVKDDNGSTLTTGMKALNHYGMPEEPWYPYNVNKFANTPPGYIYVRGFKTRISQYLNLNNANLDELKSCLASGYPFVFGVQVYDAIESDAVAKSGTVPYPSASEIHNPIGGHALTAVGYDDSKNVFIVRNSWGESWGVNGYCIFPYKYLTDTNIADDFWTSHSLV
jgi:C1A family cysteine protease